MPLEPLEIHRLGHDQSYRRRRPTKGRKKRIHSFATRCRCIIGFANIILRFSNRRNQSQTNLRLEIPQNYRLSPQIPRKLRNGRVMCQSKKMSTSTTKVFSLVETLSYLRRASVNVRMSRIVPKVVVAGQRRRRELVGERRRGRRVMRRESELDLQIYLNVSVPRTKVSNLLMASCDYFSNCFVSILRNSSLRYLCPLLPGCLFAAITCAIPNIFPRPVFQKFDKEYTIIDLQQFNKFSPGQFCGQVD